MSRCLILDIYTKYLHSVPTYVHHGRLYEDNYITMMVSLTEVKMFPQVSLSCLITVTRSGDNSQITLRVWSQTFFFFFQFKIWRGGVGCGGTRANVGHDY